MPSSKRSRHPCLIPALAARKAYHILGIHHVLLVLHVELTDAALVGVGADGIVWYAHSHPDSSLRARSLAHHLHDPSLFRVADGKGLALRVIAIGIGERGHHLDSLTSGLGALEGYVDERTIIHDTSGIHHLLSTAVCGLADGYLPLVDIAYHIIGLGSLWYLAMILIGVPIKNLAHIALGMLSRWIMAEILEHSVVVGTVRTDHRTIGRRFLPTMKLEQASARWH